MIDIKKFKLPLVADVIAFVFVRKNLKKELLFYAPFCQEVEQQWKSLQQCSHICYARYLVTSEIHE